MPFNNPYRSRSRPRRLQRASWLYRGGKAAPTRLCAAGAVAIFGGAGWWRITGCISTGWQSRNCLWKRRRAVLRDPAGNRHREKFPQERADPKRDRRESTRPLTMSQPTHPIVDLTNEIWTQCSSELAQHADSSTISAWRADWRRMAQRRHARNRHVDFGGQHPGVAASCPCHQCQIGQPKDSRQRSRGGYLLCAQAHGFRRAIYGSLKCFHGSVVALLFGLSLAVLAIGWEAIGLLRN